MKPSIFLFSLLTGLFNASAFSQSVNPPVGGMNNPELIQFNPISGARQNIMKDTLDRQYSEQEIEKYRQIIDGYERSRSGAYAEAAKIVRRRIMVGISPDSPVEEIRLNAENAGSIVFTDTIGAPWNVVDVITPSYIIPTRLNNMIVFRPASSGDSPTARKFANGSITVLLEGLNSTIPFQLSYGLSREVDGQIEAQIQARNPKGSASLAPIDSIEKDVSAGLFLDGTPPDKAKEIKTSHKSVKSWIYGDHLYVRTDLPIHSPDFSLGASSASGMSIYRFKPIPTVINAIVEGQVVSVSIGE